MCAHEVALAHAAFPEHTVVAAAVKEVRPRFNNPCAPRWRLCCWARGIPRNVAWLPAAAASCLENARVQTGLARVLSRLLNCVQRCAAQVLAEFQLKVEELVVDGTLAFAAAGDTIAPAQVCSPRLPSSQPRV